MILVQFLKRDLIIKKNGGMSGVRDETIIFFQEPQKTCHLSIILHEFC